ncbi:VIT1/CCC1 transporter family protein [Aquipuribacter sp. SD81]|uniref:VIT1/CCC1 transporter family protein n=1 Tax=Aquipuribacter sp. SD81 TaxID=3127703 RepID=UPI003015B8A8
MSGDRPASSSEAASPTGATPAGGTPPDAAPAGGTSAVGATPAGAAATLHAEETSLAQVNAKLNWLRAGVLGANDGIVSTAGLVVGVAAATTDRPTLLVAGVAALVAGALSMAGGEYVSVSTQRDTERALLAKEARELRETPDEELAELAGFYRDKGLSDETAQQVAVELTAHDALRAHAEIELGIDAEALVSPWQAALASLVSFAVGALLPLLAIVLPSPGARVPVTVAAVVVALTITGFLSARLGGAPVVRPVLRNVGVGLLAMLLTFVVGSQVGGAL